MLLMLTGSKVVFGAFTQMYTDTVYCLHAPHQSKSEGSFKPPPPHPVGLAVHHQGVEEAAIPTS